MGVPLSKSTHDRLVALFTEAEVEAAEQLIENSCAENLPLIHDASPEGLERIRFAVLKLSDGDLDRGGARKNGLAGRPRYGGFWIRRISARDVVA